MRFGTYTTLGALAAGIVGFAIAAALTRELWWGDWWFAGIVLTICVLSFAFGLIHARREGSPYDDMSVKEVRERGRRGDLPPPMTPEELRGWRRMMVLMWLAVPALPLLLLWVGVGMWTALAIGAAALCGAVSYLVVYRLMRRAADEARP